MKTRDEFRIYFRNLLVPAVLNEWYKEKKGIMIRSRISRDNGEILDVEENEISMVPNVSP